jgi:hypothetical protein
VHGAYCIHEKIDKGGKLKWIMDKTFGTRKYTPLLAASDLLAVFSDPYRSSVLTAYDVDLV